jgi:hypothetical protein
MAERAAGGERSPALLLFLPGRRCGRIVRTVGDGEEASA